MKEKLMSPPWVNCLLRSQIKTSLNKARVSLERELDRVVET